MPFLNDDEFATLQDSIKSTKTKLSDTETALAAANDELKGVQNRLEEHDEIVNKVKKTKTVQNVILSILFGAALGLAYYLYTQGKGNTSININEIKQLEATRVIDSINAYNALQEKDSNASSGDSNSIDSEVISVDDTVLSLKNKLRNVKIYSVQVGAFSENNYTLLSETLAGISSNGDLFKYSIGLFKTLREAQDFRRELVRIGFRDAFVASYVDGIRQEIEKPN